MRKNELGNCIPLQYGSLRGFFLQIYDAGIFKKKVAIFSNILASSVASWCKDNKIVALVEFSSFVLPIRREIPQYLLSQASHSRSAPKGSRGDGAKSPGPSQSLTNLELLLEQSAKEDEAIIGENRALRSQ